MHAKSGTSSLLHVAHGRSGDRTGSTAADSAVNRKQSKRSSREHKVGSTKQSNGSGWGRRSEWHSGRACS